MKREHDANRALADSAPRYPTLPSPQHAAKCDCSGSNECVWPECATVKPHDSVLTFHGRTMTRAEARERYPEPKRTWAFLEWDAAGWLQFTTPARKVLLLGLLALVLVVALGGCSSTWCEDNPRTCKAVVLTSGVVAACAVAGALAAASHSGPRTRPQPPANCTTDPALCQ